MYNRITNKLGEISSKKFWAIVGSVIFIFVLIETLLVASLIESLYLKEVHDKMYDYIYIDYDLKENTTYLVPLTIQDNCWVKREINWSTRVDILSIEFDWTTLLINISLNIVVVEGSIIIRNLTFVHRPSQSNRVYIDYTLSKINTTIDRWDMQTSTLFSISMKTSNIAKSLGISIPFWLPR